MSVTSDVATQFATSPARLVRVLAGPGTGKSYALTLRLAHLVANGQDPSRIMVVTFARAAAQDLIEAAGSVEGAEGKIRPSTLHSFCFTLLNNDKVLKAIDRTPRILVDRETSLLLKDLIGDFGTQTEREETLQAFLAAWSRKQADQPGEPVDGLDQAFQDEMRALLTWYQGMLIGEVVPIALQYLEQNPHADIFKTYDHVLVDEYQDLNRAEQDVLDLVAAKGSLAVIGDDDQSIYSFKQAHPEGIREFGDRDGVHDVQFTTCRRCPTRVVGLAQTLIQRNPDRARGPLLPMEGNPEGELHHVQWTSTAQEASGLARFLKTKIDEGVDPDECLVLVPRRLIGHGIRAALEDAGVPAATHFRQDAIAADEALEALTLLTLLADPRDRLALRAWLAVGHTDKRTKPYRRLYEEACSQNVSVGDVLTQIDAGDLQVPYTGSAVDRWHELQVRLVRMRACQDDIEALIDLVLPDDEEAVGPLRGLALALSENAEISAQSLAEQLRTVISKQDDIPEQTGEVRIMTFHNSKGLTANLVILAGLCDGMMPTRKDTHSAFEAKLNVEEGRRLFFVGLTRARQTLVLSHYAWLDTATAMRLGARMGRKVSGGGLTIVSPFVRELGHDLPKAIKGSDWAY